MWGDVESRQRVGAGNPVTDETELCEPLTCLEQPAPVNGQVELGNNDHIPQVLPIAQDGMTC